MSGELFQDAPQFVTVDGLGGHAAAIDYHYSLTRRHSTDGCGWNAVLREARQHP
jgi:hypothetical protein